MEREHEVGEADPGQHADGARQPAVQARMPAGGEVLQRFEDAGVRHQHGGERLGPCRLTPSPARSTVPA
jgi:hypothetical protein